MLRPVEWSISKISKILPVLIGLLIGINLTAFTFIGITYSFMEKRDNQSAGYLRSINQLVLAVRDSDNIVTDDVLREYDYIVVLRDKMDKKLKQGSLLGKPAFYDESSRNMYSENIRNEATLVRENMSALLEGAYRFIAFLLLVCVATNILMLFLIIRGRFSLKRYNTAITDGLEHLEKLLTFEAGYEYQKKESDIIEVQAFNNFIYKMSNDIGYNRKLIDAGFHGNLDLLMTELFSNFRKRMPCERIALAFIDASGNCIAETAVTSYNSTHLQPGFREPLSNTSLTSLMHENKGRIINDLVEYSRNKNGTVSKATSLLLKEGVRASITVPMIFDDKCIGFFFVSSKGPDCYTREMEQYVLRIINILKQKFYIEFILQQVISETSNSFVGLMAEKDNETSAHIARMSQYSYIISRAYHEHVKPLLPRFMREILWFSPLHDIGKVGIPDAVLLKEGPLTDAEMAIMKGHVNIGSRVIEGMNERILNVVASPLMRTAVEIIAGHHEKFDGKGYPAGLKGKEIPLAGRIVSVADVFDALTSRRPYKEAWSFEKATTFIEEDMRSSFDPEVLKAFHHGLPEIRKVYDKLKEV